MPALRAEDPFMTLTDIKRHTGFDHKTIKKYAETMGLPLVQLSTGKKGCFRSQLERWKSDLVNGQAAL